MKPTDPVATPIIDNTPPTVPVPDYRPVERFWPYVDLPEQPTEEELAALNPELSEALFGTPKLPFSISIDFPRFEGPDYARAVDMARASAEYRELGSGTTIRHRARFYPEDAVKLRDLFDVVGTGGLSHQLNGERFGHLNPKWDEEWLDRIKNDAESLARLSHKEVMEAAGAEGGEVIMWLIMRGALSSNVRQLHRNYYAPMTTGMALLTLQDA